MDEKEQLPLGMGMALAQNEPALERFAAMTDQQRRSVIEGARAVGSKEEMRQYVENMGRSE